MHITFNFSRKAPDSDSEVESSESGEDDSNLLAGGESYLTENDADGDGVDEGGNSSENDTKIPSSFSIHNLSKPHVSEPIFTHGQVSDMREYAMNTMRELLGIYGLTSEVAESISRQLPIAAFSSGE